MNDVQLFRMNMAEKGYEYTIEEAEQLMFNVGNLIKIFSKYTTYQLAGLAENLERDREEVKIELNWDDKDD